MYYKNSASISEDESNTLEISSDMEISYDKDLYLTFQKLKATQKKEPKINNYRPYQKSVDLSKPCHTENSTIRHNYYVNIFLA